MIHPSSFYGFPSPTSNERELAAHFSRELPTGDNRSATFCISVFPVEEKGVLYSTPPSQRSHVLRFRDGDGTPREITIFVDPAHTWIRNEQLEPSLVAHLILTETVKGPCEECQRGDVFQDAGKIHAQLSILPIALEMGAELRATQFPDGYEELEYDTFKVTTGPSGSTVLWMLCQHGLDMRADQLRKIARLWLSVKPDEKVDFTVVRVPRSQVQ